MYDNFLLDKTGQITTITLNRPEKRQSIALLLKNRHWLMRQ